MDRNAKLDESYSLNCITHWSQRKNKMDLMSLPLHYIPPYDVETYRQYLDKMCILLSDSNLVHQENITYI